MKHSRRSRRCARAAVAHLALVTAIVWPFSFVLASPWEAVPATIQEDPRPEAATMALSCPSGYYRNSQGSCTRRPSIGAASGGTAVCRNGAISYSAARSGTCSRHGGVAYWLSGSGTAGGAGLTPQCAQLLTTALSLGPSYFYALIQHGMSFTRTYRGPIDGVWGPQSERAWLTFLVKMGLVNPSLAPWESSQLGLEAVCAIAARF